MTYAVGRRSWAICDRCGTRIRYTSLRHEWTNNLVCDDCWETKHPQEDPRAPPVDGEALYHSRPSRKEPLEIVVGKTFPPLENYILPPAIGAVGQVEVLV